MPLSLRTPPREGRPREGVSAPSAARSPQDDPIDDTLDVPATVICAVCGDAGCAGCDARELTRSGIVSMIAWERSGPVGPRMWVTARATTMTGETFFESIPDGPVGPALRFAVLVEMIAACGFVASALPFVAWLAPGWLRHVVFDGTARAATFRILAIGVPALAMLLVAAHAAYGLALDVGARASGGASERSRALRFGLYTSGWDLVLGPVGAVVLAGKEGLGALPQLLRVSPGLPGRCSRSFLRGCYHLELAAVERANRSATAAAVVATLIGAALVLLGAVWLVLATN